MYLDELSESRRSHDPHQMGIKLEILELFYIVQRNVNLPEVEIWCSNVIEVRSLLLLDQVFEDADSFFVLQNLNRKHLLRIKQLSRRLRKMSSLRGEHWKKGQGDLIIVVWVGKKKLIINYKGTQILQHLAVEEMWDGMEDGILISKWKWSRIF